MGCQRKWAHGGPGGREAQRRPLLGVHQGHDRLEPREGVGPGVAEGRGAVLGQVLLPQEAEQAEDPGVLDGLSEYPDVGRALHVVVAVDQDRVPLHQPLQIHAVGQRKGGLGVSGQRVNARL